MCLINHKWSVYKLWTKETTWSLEYEFLPNEAISLWNVMRSLHWFSISSFQFNSVQFSRSVVSDSLWPHESQHASPPCPSPIPGVHSNSCPLSRWCHPAISSSVIPFSSCPQSLPASGAFPMSQLFAWGGQSTGVSASACQIHPHPQGLGFCCPPYLDCHSPPLHVIGSSLIFRSQCKSYLLRD